MLKAFQTVIKPGACDDDDDDVVAVDDDDDDAFKHAKTLNDDKFSSLLASEWFCKKLSGKHSDNFTLEICCKSLTCSF